VLREYMENSVHMSKVVCPGFDIDEDIIKKKNKMIEKGAKAMIHEALEGGGGITKAKGHDQKCIVALMSSKGSIRNV
jgi:phosphosulfolactate synthase (CoM biosynthesis protein A)